MPVITASDTAPGSPVANQLWWQSSTGQLLIRYQDPNSAQWVEVTSSAPAVTRSEYDALAARIAVLEMRA